MHQTQHKLRERLELSLYSTILIVLLILSISLSILLGSFGTPIWAQVNPNGDDDRDGLLNLWEQRGIDVNNDGRIDLNLPSLGARSNHKDIFIEIDYMQYHRPNTQAITNVITAFGRAPVSNPDGSSGINLHLEVDEQVRHQNTLVIWPGFDSIKRTSFGTFDQRSDANHVNVIAAKKLVYHYALFIHNQAEYTGSSGLAELPGNDFLVSLGGLGWGRDASGHNVGSVDQQAGTLMHELGHNLNLRHGGDVDLNCKPNYLSVMSYTRQFSNPIGNRPLDYSRSALSTLNEIRLFERIGISASLPSGLMTVIGPIDIVDTGGISIDFNHDGAITQRGPVRADTNKFPGIWGCDAGGRPFTRLRGYDDWANIQYNIRMTEGYADGAAGGAHPTVPEMTSENFKEFYTLQIEAITNTIQNLSNAEFKDPTSAVNEKVDLKNKLLAGPDSIDADVKNGNLDEAIQKIETRIKPEINSILKPSLDIEEEQQQGKLAFLLDNFVMSLEEAETPTTTSVTTEGNKTATTSPAPEEEGEAEVTSTPTPAPAPIEYATYVNSTHGLTIQYPYNWSVVGGTFQDSSITVATFYAPDDMVSLLIEVQDVSAEKLSLNEELNALIAGDREHFPNFKVIESNTDAILSGNPAFKLEFSYTDPGYESTLGINVGTTIGDKLYYVVYYAEPEKYSQYLPVIEKMIDSLEINPR